MKKKKDMRKKEDKHGYEFLEDKNCESEFGLYRRYRPDSLDVFPSALQTISLEFHMDGRIDLDEDVIDEIDTIFMSAIDQLRPIIEEAEKRLLKRAIRQHYKENEEDDD